MNPERGTNPKDPCCQMIYTWVLKGLSYHHSGAYVYTTMVLAPFGKSSAGGRVKQIRILLPVAGRVSDDETFLKQELATDLGACSVCSSWIPWFALNMLVRQSQKPPQGSVVRGEVAVSVQS